MEIRHMKPRMERQMTTKLNRLLVCVMVLGGTSIAIAEPVKEPAKEGVVSMPEELAAAANANGQFAIDLYRRTAETDSGKNVFLSPFSVSLALSIAAEGAVDQTLDQMTSVLHFPKGGLEKIHRGQQGLLASAIPNVSSETRKKIETLRARLKESNDQTEKLNQSNRFAEANTSSAAGSKVATELHTLLNKTTAYDMQISNALWIEKSYPIRPGFASAIQPTYGTVLFPVDFKQHSDPVRLQINKWVAQQTGNRIQDLLGPQSVTTLTKLIITNTVYFKGDWASPFDAAQTRPESFQQSNDHTAKLPLMHQRNSKSASYGAFSSTGELFPTPREVQVDLKDEDPSLYPDAKGHTMLSLDYQGQKIQMIVLLPQSIEGLADLERALTYESLQMWIEQLEHRTVDVTIPKFKLESTYQLPKTLQAMGMIRAFKILFVQRAHSSTN